METRNNVSEEGQLVSEQLQTPLPTGEKGFKRFWLKKLRGGVLLVIGYLLSPLSCWNDLFFNLPIAYLFGYICSWFSPNLLLPCTLVGYWISNLAGILLMQVGAIDVFQEQPKERSLKKELFMGVASSTAYTLVILGLIQLKILDPSSLFPTLDSLNLTSFVSMEWIKSFGS